jgi:hypothetical protein
MYSLRKENLPLTVLGMVLLTFKPHVGALILLAVLGWLVYTRSNLGQRVIRPLLVAAIILSLTGFIADPTWIISYPRMLLNYQGEGNVSGCSECASLPVFMSRWFFDGSLTTAALVAVVLLIAFFIVFYLNRFFLRSYELLLSAVLLVTLLVSPYLYNYDFLLLLVPIAILIPQSNLVEKIILFFCYLVPTFVLLLYGRDGNISLILVSIVMLALLFIHAKNPVIDFSGHAA